MRRPAVWQPIGNSRGPNRRLDQLALRRLAVGVFAGEVLRAVAIGPADRRVEWRGNVGIPGGIPERSTLCATIDASVYGDGVADATAAIQSALDACPDDEVVMLPAGTYRVHFSHYWNLYESEWYTSDVTVVAPDSTSDIDAVLDLTRDDIVMDFGAGVGVWVNRNDDPADWSMVHSQRCMSSTRVCMMSAGSCPCLASISMTSV